MRPSGQSQGRVQWWEAMIVYIHVPINGMVLKYYFSGTWCSSTRLQHSYDNHTLNMQPQTTSIEWFRTSDECVHLHSWSTIVHKLDCLHKLTYPSPRSSTVYYSLCSTISPMYVNFKLHLQFDAAGGVSRWWLWFGLPLMGLWGLFSFGFGIAAAAKPVLVSWSDVLFYPFQPVIKAKYGILQVVPNTWNK